MVETYDPMPKASEINPTHIRAHIKDLESETCKILTKDNAKTITIFQLDDGDEGVGCFVPIVVIDISECKFKSSIKPELFDVEIE